MKAILLVCAAIILGIVGCGLLNQKPVCQGKDCEAMPSLPQSTPNGPGEWHAPAPASKVFPNDAGIPDSK